MAKRKYKRRIKKRIIRKNCYFCESKTEPHYLDVKTLGKYLTERGKIISRTRNGNCNRHQQALSTAIKRARYLALLPYIVRV